MKTADRLVTASVKLTRRLRALDPAPKLSGAQASALAIVIFAKEIKPSALAALEEVKRATMARTIGQLEEKGLIRRNADPEDARSVFLKATPAGLRLFREGQRRRINPLHRALGRLPAADRRVLANALPVLERLADLKARKK